VPRRAEKQIQQVESFIAQRVNALAEAVKAVDRGRLDATVFQNARSQAKSV
jgi:ABC-type sugar transport system substrate-binding protein